MRACLNRQSTCAIYDWCVRESTIEIWWELDSNHKSSTVYEKECQGRQYWEIRHDARVPKREHAGENGKEFSDTQLGHGTVPVKQLARLVLLQLSDDVVWGRNRFVPWPRILWRGVAENDGCCWFWRHISMYMYVVAMAPSAAFQR